MQQQQHLGSLLKTQNLKPYPGPAESESEFSKFKYENCHIINPGRPELIVFSVATFCKLK
jgi:hypothetical protein